MVPGYSRPAGAVTHRHQRVVHGLLLRMSLEPQIAAVGGFESRAAHQFPSKQGLNENCHGVAAKQRSRASPSRPVAGRARHGGVRKDEAGNYALAGQSPLSRCRVAPNSHNATMRNVESYITKNEHGYGFGCLPSWLYVERRPCSLAMRAA